MADMVWLVFDNDWGFTKGCIQDTGKMMASELEHSFLRPNVEDGDESNNWANRGSFLRAYRDLVAELMRQDVYAGIDGTDE